MILEYKGKIIFIYKDNKTLNEIRNNSIKNI